MMLERSRKLYAKKLADIAAAEAAAAVAAAENEAKRKKAAEDCWRGNPSLAELLKPPLDHMFRGSFEEAREFAFSRNQWLLVSLQESSDFRSHTLNRDVWKHAEVQAALLGFVLWQEQSFAPDGKQFVAVYKPRNVPCVAILNPHTSSQVDNLSPS